LAEFQEGGGVRKPGRGGPCGEGSCRHRDREVLSATTTRTLKNWPYSSEPKGLGGGSRVPLDRGKMHVFGENQKVRSRTFPKETGVMWEKNFWVGLSKYSLEDVVKKKSKFVQGGVEVKVYRRAGETQGKQ